jgi:hypothetical protein
MAFALSGWRLAHGAGGPDVLGGVLAVGGLLWQLPLWLRKPVFVVVTRRQLVCFLLSRLDPSGTPRARMFAVPLVSGSITRSRWSLRYTGPDGKTIRLNKDPLAWHARRDMNEVVAALQASLRGQRPVSRDRSRNTPSASPRRPEDLYRPGGLGDEAMPETRPASLAVTQQMHFSVFVDKQKARLQPERFRKQSNTAGRRDPETRRLESNLGAQRLGLGSLRPDV